MRNPFAVRLIIFFFLCAFLYWLRFYINVHITYALISITNYYPILLVYPFVLLFAYVCRDRIKAFQDYRIDALEMAFFGVLALGVLSIPFTFFDGRDFHLIFTLFAPLYLGYAFLFISIFGVRFVKAFTEELLIILGIMYALLFFFVVAEKYWTFFSYAILKVLSFVLPLFSDKVHFRLADYNVTLQQFSVNIGAPCAGTYSLMLFVVFFGISLFFLRRRGHILYGRALMVFLAGFATLFILNVLRIVVIIMVGAYYSPEIAISIFHEYLGSVLFIGFLFVYLSYITPFIFRPSAK